MPPHYVASPGLATLLGASSCDFGVHLRTVPSGAFTVRALRCAVKTASDGPRRTGTGRQPARQTAVAIAALNDAVPATVSR